jgi:serine/threonine protein kinase
LVKKLNSPSKELFVLKAIVVQKTFQEINRELSVGMNVAQNCEYLVSYKEFFYLEASSTICIIMEYFKSSDLENYLISKFKEGYFFSVSVLNLFKYKCYFVLLGNN